jgi:hypothetical protein
MLPLNAAPISDLGPGDFVEVGLLCLRPRRATDDQDAAEGRPEPYVQNSRLEGSASVPRVRREAAG